MAKDKVSSTDQVEAGIVTKVVPPEHPCPICGTAMKNANTVDDRKAGRSLRTCANRDCRAKADWTSGKGVLLNN